MYASRITPQQLGITDDTDSLFLQSPLIRSLQQEHAVAAPSVAPLTSTPPSASPPPFTLVIESCSRLSPPIMREIRSFECIDGETHKEMDAMKRMCIGSRANTSCNDEAETQTAWTSHALFVSTRTQRYGECVSARVGCVASCICVCACSPLLCSCLYRCICGVNGMRCALEVA